MPFQASKLDLLKTSSSPHSVSSLLFEHSSNSLALSLSDSSHLLFPSFSPSSPSLPPTVVPSASTAVSFLRLLPTSRVLFFAAAPLDAGAALALRAWILHLNPPRFASVRLTYKKSAPATLPLAHGFGVRLIGTVNYFVVHAPAASQIWVMAARIEEGEGNELMSIDLVKCAVVDCDLPIYSIGMSTGVMVLGEIGGVRVFPMRTLVKGGELKGKRKGYMAAGKSGDRLFGLGKRAVPNGVIIPVSRPDGGASARVEGIMEEKTDGNQAPGKLRCARLRQISGDLCSFFIKIKCNNTISESNSGALTSVKAISIHVLSQKQFLILDSVGDLHLLTLHGTFTASEVRADSSSKYAQMYCLDVKMKVQVLAVPPDISARPEFIWISDGAYSVYMMSMANIGSPEKGGEKDDKKEKSTLLSAAQVIFTSEKVQHIIALSAKAILVLGQGNIFAYSIS
ncbi:uncharacterized protein LOC110115014 isoform X1 [Dendrobium catenatum]|uniref:uncharacterized protein LOC110115014 isoform X1 n=1 Tax=Dendrobium catenatum TaxID=906689 RepID=UPI0009F6B4EC|nr:uncharacterized protein LOC110115014 isoform X1 [Dendrobium catenatum]XP_020703765.1 uncharacterized protein LOC110115014 isoform X1 [Dendrobium catenatum]